MAVEEAPGDDPAPDGQNLISFPQAWQDLLAEAAWRRV